MGVAQRYLVAAERAQLAIQLQRLSSVTPRWRWLKAPDPEFDFFDFEEAERLLVGAEEATWRTMILVALRTGMRQGEIFEMTMRYAHLAPHIPRDAVKLLDHGGRLGKGWAKTEKPLSG